MKSVKTLKKGLQRDVAQIEECIQDILNKYELQIRDDTPFYRREVIRTGIDLANIELKYLYFQALHVRARYFLARHTRRFVNKSRYQAILTSLEEKVRFLEEQLKKGNIYNG